MAAILVEGAAAVVNHLYQGCSLKISPLPPRWYENPLTRILQWTKHSSLFALGSLKSTRLILSGHPAYIPLDFQAVFVSKTKLGRIFRLVPGFSWLKWFALRVPLSPCLGHRILNSLIFKAHDGMLAFLPDHRLFESVASEVHDFSYLVYVCVYL